MGKRAREQSRAVRRESAQPAPARVSAAPAAPARVSAAPAAPARVSPEAVRALPVSVQRLDHKGRGLYFALQNQAVEVQLQQDRLRDQVGAARELGMSWHAIGYALAMTGEGARLRYGAKS